MNVHRAPVGYQKKDARELADKMLKDVFESLPKDIQSTLQEILPNDPQTGERWKFYPVR